MALVAIERRGPRKGKNKDKTDITHCIIVVVGNIFHINVFTLLPTPK